MKGTTAGKGLRVQMLVLGIAALALRKMLYAAAVDVKGLLLRGQPLEIALTVLTLGVLIRMVLAVRQLKGTDHCENMDSPNLAAAFGNVAAGAGILVTVLTAVPVSGGYLESAWRFLGLAAPVCLLLAGVSRALGKKPFFLLHVVTCLFFLVHIVTHYQLWSANPQLQDYFYDLGGIMLLMLFAYYQTAFDTDSGNRRMQLAAGLLAALWSFTAVSRTEFPLLYAACGIWALTDLCTLTPVSRRNMGAAEQQREE